MLKNTFIIIGLAVLLAILVLSLREGDQDLSLPKVSLCFAGFTNNPYGKPEIRFFFTNYSERLSWDVAEMSKETTNGWEAVKIPSDFIRYATEPLPSSFAIGIPVTETNVRWRLIFRFNEKTAGLEGIVDSGIEVLDKIKTGVRSERYMGRMYFVTNEIINAGKE